jgi:signal transduction histidine kinase
MTARAEDWSEHDLDRRFDLGPPGDELSGLAATLDRLLGRIAASRRHEQRFASEVAHEMRTPIAGLRGRAELALAATGPDADRERDAALRAVVTHTDRVTAAVDALLAAARGELSRGTASTNLVALVRELQGVELEGATMVPAAEGEPELLRRALQPIIDNARRHARSRVVVRLTSEASRVRLDVIDDGPGVDPALGERVFDPGVRGAGEHAEGAGLGLALARRLARSCGGDVYLGTGPGGHVVLDLPATTPA